MGVGGGVGVLVGPGLLVRPLDPGLPVLIAGSDGEHIGVQRHALDPRLPRQVTDIAGMNLRGQGTERLVARLDDVAVMLQRSTNAGEGAGLHGNDDVPGTVYTYLPRLKRPRGRSSGFQRSPSVATRAGTLRVVKSSMRMPRWTSCHVTGVDTVASGLGRTE